MRVDSDLDHFFHQSPGKRPEDHPFSPGEQEQLEQALPAEPFLADLAELVETRPVEEKKTRADELEEWFLREFGGEVFEFVR